MENNVKEICFETRIAQVSLDRHRGDDETETVCLYRRSNPDGSMSPWIHPTSMVSMTAHIHYTAIIGRDVTIRNGARIGYGCRIFNGATIGEEAEIGPRSKVMFNALIGAGTKLNGSNYVSVSAYVDANCVLEYSASVQRNASVGEGSVIGYGTEVKEKASVAAKVRVPGNCELHHFHEFEAGQKIRDKSGEEVEITAIPEPKFETWHDVFEGLTAPEPDPDAVRIVFGDN